MTPTRPPSANDTDTTFDDPALSAIAEREDTDTDSAKAERLQARDSRRGRKVQRTRRHIAETALNLFVTKGYAATTIEEIADAADYSTSTFFRLFADKEEVVFYDFGERMDELQAAFTMPHEGNAWVTIRNAFIGFAKRWDGDGDAGRQRAQLFHGEPSLKFRYLAKNHEWEGAIAKLVANELGAGAHVNLNAYVIAGAAVAAFRSAWQSQYESRKKIALATCVEQAFDQLENIGTFFRTTRGARRA